MAAYLILRAFSWQIRLSPVAFEEYAAALFVTHPTPLMDEVGFCPPCWPCCRALQPCLLNLHSCVLNLLHACMPFASHDQVVQHFEILSVILQSRSGTLLPSRGTSVTVYSVCDSVHASTNSVRRLMGMPLIKRLAVEWAMTLKGEPKHGRCM